MTSPSRQFMVQQAVLNTVDYYSPFYSKTWCASWNRDWLPKPFLAEVRAQYRRLAAQYRVAA